MRSSLFCVVLYGDYGLVLPLWRLGHFLEKWAISSASLPTPFLRVFLTSIFSAFKYCCRARGEKLERTNISYACLAQVVREGGFRIALVARMSAIPGHCKLTILDRCRTS